MSDLHSVQPRPIVDIIGVLGSYRLLDRARLYSGETPHGGGKVPVGSWIIDSPVARAPHGYRAVHKTREHPLARYVGVRRDRKVVIFPGWIFAKLAGLLRRSRAALADSCHVAKGRSSAQRAEER